MAKFSEEARLNMFPALMHRLDGPPDYALGPIAQGKYNFFHISINLFELLPA